VDVGVGRQGKFDDGIFLPLAEEDADGGVLVGSLHEAVEVVHIHLHLPQILMVELVELQVDNHIAAQQTVVEDEIDEKMVLVEGEALLAGLEEKSLAELKQEVFQLIYDCGFHVGFGIARFLVQSKEFKDVRFFENVRRLDDYLSFVSKFTDAFLVSAES
jgi:hypothetical protein